MIDLTIFFDIETLPSRDPRLIEEIVEGIQPPSRMSKAETIAKWEIEEKPAAILEAVAKTSLDGGTGRLASIAFAIGDGPIQAEVAVEEDGTSSEDTERWLLQGFFAACEDVKTKFAGAPPIMCGHNILQFDLRWLWKRAIILGVTVPWWWPHDARAWDADRVQDTMLMWEGPGGRIRQDVLARRLGIVGKPGGFDGSMVAQAWVDGEFNRIRDYCADDVRCVREIYRRLTGHTTARPTKARKSDRAPAEIEAPPVDASEQHEEFGVCF